MELRALRASASGAKPSQGQSLSKYSQETQAASHITLYIIVRYACLNLDYGQVRREAAFSQAWTERGQSSPETLLPSDILRISVSASAICDVCARMKSPTDRFLRTRPRH